jgi:hypothetical protein
METTLGLDWASFFDLSCFNNHGPLFFTTESKFYAPNFKEPDFRSYEIDVSEEYLQNSI